MKMFQYAAAASVLAMGTTAFGAQAFLTDGGPSESNTPTPSVEFDISDGTGSLYTMVDTSPEGFTFRNGSFSVTVTSSTAGVVEFTGAEVFNPQFFGGFVTRWNDGGNVVNNLSTDSIGELLGVSVNTGGMVDPDDPSNADPNVDASGNFVFAKIDFNILGPGSTTLSMSEGDSLIVQGTDTQNGFQSSQGDVSDDVTLTGTTVNVVPEPATAGLLVLGGLALLRRRRA